MSRRSLNLAAIESSLVDGRTKGMPPRLDPVPLGEVGARGWNVLRGDLCPPVAVLRESAVRHNIDWMRRFLEGTGVRLCPHGKTTMSPQLFERQLADGAWGITVATPAQLRVCREHGVDRVVLANQLVDPAAIDYVLDELERDPAFDFYCLADSLEAVRILSERVEGRLPAAVAARGGAAGGADPEAGPLQVLVEVGLEGGRTGVRSVPSAVDVARAVHAAPGLALRGVEGFEGLVTGEPADAEERIRAFLGRMVTAAERFADEGLLAPGPLLLTAGGSAYFDLVVDVLGRADPGRETEVVIRSGCYLTHDHSLYRERLDRMVERAPGIADLGPGLRPALEVWSYVQSRPEPDRAILGLGKRDCSFDAGYPLPIRWYRSGGEDRVRPLGGHRITGLNDQHAYMDLPPDSPLRVGDLVACGISHPCTTFDRWDVIAVVDDDYDVVSAIRTFF